jgi:hypothetical protein
MSDIRNDLLTSYNDTVEKCDHVISEGLAGYVLVNDDMTLAIIETSDGQLRFGSFASDRVFLLSQRTNAIKARSRWNKALNEQQIRAGCQVQALTYVDAALSARLNARAMIQMIEAVAAAPGI